MFRLLCTAGDQTIDLEPGRTLIVCRAVTSDVPIYDPTISRKHAEVALTGTVVRVKDLGSSNGTFLNGARITEGDAAANDVITFGKVALRVMEVAPPRCQARRELRFYSLSLRSAIPSSTGRSAFRAHSCASSPAQLAARA